MCKCAMQEVSEKHLWPSLGTEWGGSFCRGESRGRLLLDGLTLHLACSCSTWTMLSPPPIFEIDGAVESLRADSDNCEKVLSDEPPPTAALSQSAALRESETRSFWPPRSNSRDTRAPALPDMTLRSLAMDHARTDSPSTLTRMSPGRIWPSTSATLPGNTNATTGPESTVTPSGSEKVMPTPLPSSCSCTGGGVRG